MSYIYGDRFGPEWALRHDGQKNGAHGGGVGAGAARRGIVVRWGLRGVRWGGAVGLAVLWPTRRAAPWYGFLVRARGPSAAWGPDRRHRLRSGRCGHFCMNAQPHRPPRLDAREFLPVRSTVAAFA